MIVLNSEWKEIQESLMAKDAHIKALRETMVATMEEKDDRIEKLTRACSVLYFGSEDYLRRLAENEYSGCASTQRKELKELLEGSGNDSNLYFSCASTA
jgi:hypothetical protein